MLLFSSFFCCRRSYLSLFYFTDFFLLLLHRYLSLFFYFFLSFSFIVLSTPPGDEMKSTFQVFCLYLKINFIHTFGQIYLLFILNSFLNLILFSFLAVKADQTRCRSYYGILVERIMLGTKLILLLHLFFFFFFGKKEYLINHK